MSGPRLVLDAAPAQVAVARAFAVSVMRVLEFADDRVDSVRLAVSELVTELVLADVDEVALGFADGVLRIEVPATPAPTPALGARRMALLDQCLGGLPTPNGVGGWDLDLLVVPA